MGILCSFVGCIAIYAALFSTGCFLYGRWAAAFGLLALTVVSALLLFRCWKKLEQISVDNGSESLENQ